MTITEFLLARIAEDEAVIVQHAAEESAIDYVGHGPDLDGTWLAVVDGNMDNPTIGIGPGRFRAECETKRRIVHLHVATNLGVRLADEPSQPDRCSCCRRTEWPCSTLRGMASVYADHSDFDPAWR